MAISFPLWVISPNRQANGQLFYVLVAKHPTVFEKPVANEVLFKTAESRSPYGYTPRLTALFRQAIRHIVVP
jgi:hypothetical protein